MAWHGMACGMAQLRQFSVPLWLYGDFSWQLCGVDVTAGTGYALDPDLTS